MNLGLAYAGEITQLSMIERNDYEVPTDRVNSLQ